MTEDVDLPALLYRAQQQAAIDARNKFSDRMTDEGCENYLSIAYELIKSLEDDRTTMPSMRQKKSEW